MLRQRGRRGFSLVEIIVTITVVAGLMGTAFIGGSNIVNDARHSLSDVPDGAYTGFETDSTVPWREAALAAGVTNAHYRDGGYLIYKAT